MARETTPADQTISLRRAHAVVVLAGLVGASVLLAGCGSSGGGGAKAAAPDTFTAHLQLWTQPNGAKLLLAMENVPDSKFGKAGSTTCVDQDQLVTPGTEVTVKDSSGKIVALGRVNGPGEIGDGGLSAPCIFSVDINDVPAGSGFYQVTVGSSGNPFTLKEKEMRDPEMTVGYGYKS